MPKKAPAVPTANATPGDVPLMPWERQGADTDEGAATKSLFEALASDPDVGDETTEEADEPAAPPAEAEEEAESEDEPEAEAAEEAEDESEEDEEEAEGGEEQPSYEVTLPGGEKAKVTLDELLKGYSRTADYTRKTQATAEERKQAQAERDAARQAREQYSRQLAQLEQTLAEAMPPEPDWDTLSRQNPAEFNRQWALHQHRAAKLQAVQAEQARVQAEQMAEYEMALREKLAEESRRLIEAIPEWADEAKQKEAKRALRNYAVQTYGFTDDDLGNVYDHRVMVLLRKAMLYDELKTKGEKELPAKKAAAKVLKPGGRAEPAKKGRKAVVKRAKDKLARTGSVDDAAAAIFAMIGDDD